jgi:invasion protein IalB
MRRALPLIVMIGSLLAVSDACAVTLNLEDSTAQQNTPSSSSNSSQNGRSSQGQPSQPSKATSAAPEPQAVPPPRVPQRTEILNFDNWVVTCQEFADAPRKRACNAQLRAEQSGSTQIILVWTMYVNDSKQLVGVLQMPTGVMIGPGVEVTLGETPARRFVYESCDSSRCAATLVLDSTFIRDAAVASTAAANIHAINGSAVRMSFPIKGFDRAHERLKANAN